MSPSENLAFLFLFVALLLFQFVGILITCWFAIGFVLSLYYLDFFVFYSCEALLKSLT